MFGILTRLLPSLGALSKFFGPKVLFGLLIAAVLTLGGTFWLWRSAENDADQAAKHVQAAKQELREAREAATANAETARRLRAEIDKLESISADRSERIDAIRSSAAAHQAQLQRGIANADQKLQACLSDRLPDAILRSLYGDSAPTGDGNKGRD